MAAEPTIQEVLGGYVVEAFVAILLYGIFIAQTYVYAMNCNKDALYLKLCVACIAVIETAHSIFVVHVAYTYAINSFGNLAGVVDHVIWSVGASVICELIIVVIVQSLYIRRIYILSGGNLVLTLIISLLLFLRLAFGFASVALLYTLNTWSGFRFGKAFFTVTTALSLSSLVDLLFALTLTYYLRRAKTGFKKTDNMVHVLMAYSVNTGLLTMICSTVIILTFCFMDSSLVFAGFVQMSSKLYANSLMGTLNARDILHRMGTTGKSRYAISLSELAMRLHTTQRTTVPQHIEIEMSTTVAHDVQEGPDTSYSGDKDSRPNVDQESTKGYPL